MKEENKKVVLVNKRTGERLEVDPENTMDFTPEEFKKTTLYKRQFRKDAYIDEKAFSENEEDENYHYPTQEEIEEEAYEALREMGYVFDDDN